MGNRDYRGREQKKPKKNAKKIVQVDLEPQTTVEIIKKGKKPRDDDF